MKQVWFIRHGETIWNREHRIQGWTDIPLNENGRRQARALARHLCKTAIDKIVTSDLERARETAAILQRSLEQPIITDSRLRERGLGPAEGQLRSELKDGFLMDMKGAESLSDVQKRIQAVLKDFHTSASPLPTVCVTHGGWIRNMLQLLAVEQIPVIRNTSVTKLCRMEDGWHVLEIGQMPHLQKGRDSINKRRQA